MNLNEQLLDEAKIDIIKISGLIDLLASKEGQNLVQERLKIAVEKLLAA